jgi:hypothetical protein
VLVLVLVLRFLYLGCANIKHRCHDPLKNARMAMIGDCVPISNFLKIPIYSYNINIVAPSSDCKADEWTFDGLDIFMMSV